MYVEVSITIVSIVGMVLYYSWEINSAIERIREKLVLNVGHVEIVPPGETDISQDGLNQKIRRLMHATIGIDPKKLVYVFWLITLSLPLSVTGIVGRSLPVSIVLISNIMLALFPFIVLTARLKTIRVKSSKEGKLLLVELLDNYKIHYYNMQHAIEITAATLDEAPNCRKLLFNLSKGLNRVRSNEEIKEVLKDFKYAIGTSWAGVLSDNIYFALSSGIRVEVAMEDLIRTITMAEEIEEKSKRENNEVGLILKYLVPLCYVFTVLGGIKFFDLSLRDFVRYQFQTSTGLWWLSVVIILYLSSIIANFFLTQNKLDL